MWCYTYVIQSVKNERLYTGHTTDLRRRLKEHNTGHSGWTKNRGPYELIYYESCTNIQDAQSRELFLKSGMGKRYIKNRLKNLLSSNRNESR